MIQLCYASTRVEQQFDLIQDLSDILVRARSFNTEKRIFGVLYYAEGRFFQCLQGEQAALEQLFQHITQDTRHQDIVRYPDQSIDQIDFSKWSMKYVNRHSEIASLFQRFGHSSFQPDLLNTEQIQAFLTTLLRLENVEQPVKLDSGYKNRGYQHYF
ncbi:BLUF domain-containing protein [Acinetobacter sp. ANC 4945]|uniref:Blue light sensor protein n=1 Tax=Acinetobacter amyesii TaxID=2942470 RepID=A0A1T1H5F4_9GAMM|nr:BLUF domain-containing protein [Acinetobacter amyesii]MCL6249258.1 BLUF domain-containing protein [Acinetobacter amyesii]OOV85025.1 blue light sensor protein [Acinetobacter amyesii]